MSIVHNVILNHPSLVQGQSYVCIGLDLRQEDDSFIEDVHGSGRGGKGGSAGQLGDGEGLPEEDCRHSGTDLDAELARSQRPQLSTKVETQHQVGYCTSICISDQAYSL